MSTASVALSLLGAAALAVGLLAACSPGTTDSDTPARRRRRRRDGSPVADVWPTSSRRCSRATRSRHPPSLPGDVSSLAGKTVYYVPLTAQVSVFQLYGDKLGEALAEADVDLQICDGGSNPSQIAGCIGQAVRRVGRGDHHRQHPVRHGRQRAWTTPGPPASPCWSPTRWSTRSSRPTRRWPTCPARPPRCSPAPPTGSSPTPTARRRWSSRRSPTTPRPSPARRRAEKEFADRCPDCTVVVNEVSATNFPLIPSSTSSALLQQPGRRLRPRRVRALRPADHRRDPADRARPRRSQIVTSAATLAGLQQLADGNLLSADVGQDFGYQGWATADAALPPDARRRGGPGVRHRLPPVQPGERRRRRAHRRRPSPPATGTARPTTSTTSARCGAWCEPDR